MLTKIMQVAFILFFIFFSVTKTEIIAVGDNTHYVYGMGYAPQTEPFKTNLTLT